MLTTSNSTSKSADSGNVRSLERDSGISDHGLEDENAEYGENDDYDDIDCQQFENKQGLSQDLRFLFGMPELCDVMFIVGEERQPMYGVKAVLAIRSRVFYKMLYGPRSKSKVAAEVVSSSNTATVTVTQLGRRLLGKNAAEIGDQRRNFSFLRHPQVSLRAAASFSASAWQGASNQTQKTVVQVDDFDADVFKQLLEYVHTGSVVLRPRTLLGLLNAADHFALEELRRACADYSQKCINLDTVCSLLVTAERYIQYKSSKIFVQRVLDFVDKNGDDVLQLTDFVHLPRHVVELILSRDELNACEMNKFQAALRWSRHYMLYHPHDSTLQSVMAPFTQYIAFHSMTAHQLMHEIRPMDVVPDRILMNALAFQADPNSVTEEILPTRFNSGSTSRVKTEPAEEESKSKLAAAISKRSIAKSRPGNHGNRSRSVDRNLSKISNHSSNCSDYGFHDDYCHYYSPADTVIVARDSLQEGTRKKPAYRRHRRMTPGATVVHIESPADNECVLEARAEEVDTKAKSCHDLTLLPNLTSVHYRF